MNNWNSCSQTEKCELSFCPGAEPSPALLVAGPSRRRVRKCSKEAGTKPEETAPRIKGKPGRKPKPKSGRGWTKLCVAQDFKSSFVSKAEPCHSTEEPPFSFDSCHLTIVRVQRKQTSKSRYSPFSSALYWTNLSNAFITATEALICWSVSCSILPSLVNKTPRNLNSSASGKFTQREQSTLTQLFM